MSILLADIDATCSGLGKYDGNQYYAAPDVLQSLKVAVVHNFPFRKTIFNKTFYFST